MEKEISKPEFRELVGSAVPGLSDYSIGFVLPAAAPGVLDASLGGSGTLATVDGTHGILTARHVIELLEKSQHVGLVLAGSTTQLHNVLVNMDHCQRVVLVSQG
jgi:hypothetical protein